MSPTFIAFSWHVSWDATLSTSGPSASAGDAGLGKKKKGGGLSVYVIQGKKWGECRIKEGSSRTCQRWEKGWEGQSTSSTMRNAPFPHVSLSREARVPWRCSHHEECSISPCLSILKDLVPQRESRSSFLWSSFSLPGVFLTLEAGMLMHTVWKLYSNCLVSD